MESWQRTIAATQAERQGAKMISNDNFSLSLHVWPTKCARCLAQHRPQLHRETSEGPRSVRRCGQGSESTRNSHKGKNLDTERDHLTSMLLWERVWAHTRIYKTPLDRTQSKISSTHIHTKTRNWQPLSAVVACMKPGEEHTSNFIFGSAQGTAVVKRAS